MARKHVDRAVKPLPPEVKKDAVVLAAQTSWWHKFVPASRKHRAELEAKIAAEKAAIAAREAELHSRKKEAQVQRDLIKKDIREETNELEKKAASEVPKIDHSHEPEIPLKRKKVRRRRSLRELLALAGLEHLESMLLYKRLFLAAVLITLAITFFTMVVKFFLDGTLRTVSGFLGYLGFIAALWTVVFVAIVLLLAAGFAVYLDLRINARRKEIEEVFPDYLQLAAANLSAGMTIDRALWQAVRPRFGVLAREIEDVAKKTMTGYDLERALAEFSEKYDSPTLRRSVNLIVEGIHSGGRLADILNRIAVNIQENAILQKEMSANVTTYVIFISFATVAAAPFLFGLATQLLLVIQSIAGSIAANGGGSSSGMGITISADVVSRSDFRLFSITILTISSIMSASIVSVIRKGTVKDGIRLIPFFWAITVALYFIAVWGLHFMFRGVTG